MRLALKLLALLIFAPIALGLVLLLTVVAIIGLPLLWEQLAAKFTAPPDGGSATV